MVTRIAHRAHEGEREIIEIEGGGFSIPSFTSEKSYTVHPESGYCSCPRYRIRGHCEKHVELARAVQKCRVLRLGARIAEARVSELAHAVYRPVEWGEDYVASYDLLVDVLSSRYATDGMKRQAVRRHGRVLAKHERRAA